MRAVRDQWERLAGTIDPIGTDNSKSKLSRWTLGFPEDDGAGGLTSKAWIYLEGDPFLFSFQCQLTWNTNGFTLQRLNCATLSSAKPNYQVPDVHDLMTFLKQAIRSTAWFQSAQTTEWHKRCSDMAVPQLA
jgi:hypothetical protein